MVLNGRLLDGEKIGVRVGRVINQYKMAKHFELDISYGQFTFRINTQSVDIEAALDGSYVIGPICQTIRSARTMPFAIIRISAR